MSNLNEKYWELIEKGDFNELSQEEQLFVQEHFSRADFEFHTKINSAAQSDNLMLKSSNRGTILSLASKPPKYQYKYIIGLVAGFLIMFGIYSIFLNKELNLNAANKIYLTDTVYQQRLIQDTIYITKNPDTVYQKVYLDRTNKSFPNVMVLNQSQIGVPTSEVHSINQEDIVNKGTPADDREVSLVHDFAGSSRFQ